VPCDPQNPHTPAEIKLLKDLDSPFIVKYHDSFVEKQWLCIV
jgi:serine/threonine protein kinase